MKRFLQLSLVGALAFAMVAPAAAQQVPTQVTRMGDWVEIGNDVFMNIIATTDWRYQFNTNTDFESKIRDRVGSRANQSTVPHNGTGDILFEESRIGVDMRYRKNLTMRVLFEQQQTIDGNRIDNGFDTDGDPPASQTFDDGRNLNCSANGGCAQLNTVNLERAWMNYKFDNMPLAIEVGARLWTTDPAGVLGDDDPRFAVFLDLGPLQLQAAAVIQTESLRIGLTNDNDDVYYTFGASYDIKPFTIGLDMAYFRFRFSGARGQGNEGQEHDTVLIMPSITGSVGPISFLAQPMFVLGSAKGTNAGGSRDFDVFGYGFIGQVEVNLGVVRPFFAVVFGSGDDDPNDKDLDAFSPLPQGEITLTTGQKYFGVFDIAPSWGGRDVFPPAAFPVSTSGSQFMHSVGNPFNDLVQPVPDLSTTYANPGTLLLAPGVQIFPFKGHEVDVYYIYRRVLETEGLEVAVGRSVDKSMSHELGFLYSWAPNSHFDFRAMGAIVIPSEGIKDIAAAQDCNFDVAGVQSCDGEDVALYGQLRFRARF